MVVFFATGRRMLLLRCLEKLEEITGCGLGSPDRPLLLAVRAGSCVSMPGMMDTILNVGFNRETAEGLGRIIRKSHVRLRMLLQADSEVFRLGVRFCTRRRGRHR